MSRILIPIDFSECSKNALRYGLSFAKGREDNPQIIIAHGYQIPVPAAEFSMSMNATLLEEFKMDAEEKFEDLKNEIPELRNNNIQFDIKLAFVLDAILKVIQEEKPSLVIMGTKGSSGLNEVIFGSNTSGVIKASTVPVIAVPENYKDKGISRITFACDNKKLEDINILQILKDLAVKHNATLDVLHVKASSKEENDGINEIAKFFEDIDHEFHVIDNKNIAEGIEEYMASGKSDMLTMVPRKHNLFERLFTGSVTTKVAHHTMIPLLAIPAN